MERAQHQRYLVYLKKYEYFGRGLARLDAEAFGLAEAEIANLAIPTATTNARRRELLKLLLRD